MKGHALNHQDATQFITAGNATVTFLNTKSGNRFTFKIKKCKQDRQTVLKDDIFFVSILTSPDTYQYIGTMKDGSYKHGKTSKISTTAQSVQVFNYVLKKLQSNSLPTFIEIWHEGKCGRCGRDLTVPESIENGLGPECIKMVVSPDVLKQMKRDRVIKSIIG